METVIIRKKCLQDLDHNFDERFSMIEEYDFFLRILVKWKLEYVDQVLAKWRIHPESWTWKKAKLFPIEREMMIDKFINVINNFENDYKEEIEALKIRGLINKFEILWSQNKNNLARKYLKNHIFYNKKIFSLYFLSFFPFKFFKFFKQKIQY